MTFKSTAVAVLTMAFLQPSFHAFADGHAQHEQQGQKQRHHKKGWKKNKEAMKALNLNEEQREKVKEIRKALREVVKPLREQMRPKKKALGDKMAEEGVTEEQLKALHAEINELHTKIRNEQFASLLKIRAVLNPEQRKKMHKMMKVMGHGGPHHMKRGKGRHGGGH